MSSDGSDSSPLNDPKGPTINVTLPQENPAPQSDEDDEPPQLSSEQLLRRASFKKILEDLSSSADALNKPSGLNQLVSGSTSVTPSQVSVLQQAAGLAAANPALLPILQNLQQSALATAVASQAATAPPPPPPPPPPPNPDFSQQLAAAAMMLPGAAQLNAQQQLTAALLHSQQANTQSPLIANAASLAGHNNLQLPANLLSSALLNATSNPLTNFSAQLASAGGGGGGAGPTLSLNKPSLRTVSNTDSLSTSPIGGGDHDTTKKREVRLMKNREAARECRRKKKEYIRCLENRVAVLESQNQALIGELRALKELYLPKNQE